MNKLRHGVTVLALLCLVLGIVGIGVGFFMGSSPVAIQNHGNLTEYMSRLEFNRDVLMENVRYVLAFFGVVI